MSKLSDFFKPSWKKLGWFFLVLFVATAYSSVLMAAIPLGIVSDFINFVLNPFSLVFGRMRGLDATVAFPIAVTLNAMWNYLLGTLLAREISKDK